MQVKVSPTAADCSSCCRSLINEDGFQLCSRWSCQRSRFRYNRMPLRTVCFMLSLYVLSMLESVQCYFYQTEPLFLSFSELAALEENSPGETSRFGEHQVNALVLNCHQDSVEVVIKVPQFDPSLPLELWRLGSVGVGQHLCSAKASGDGEFTIRAPLGACGSNLTVGEPLNPNVTWVSLQECFLDQCCNLVLLFW